MKCNILQFCDRNKIINPRRPNRIKKLWMASSNVCKSIFQFHFHFAASLIAVTFKNLTPFVRSVNESQPITVSLGGVFVGFRNVLANPLSQTAYNSKIYGTVSFNVWSYLYRSWLRFHLLLRKLEHPRCVRRR